MTCPLVNKKLEYFGGALSPSLAPSLLHSSSVPHKVYMVVTSLLDQGFLIAYVYFGTVFSRQ